MNIKILLIVILSIVLMVLLFTQTKKTKKETYYNRKNKKIRVVIPQYGGYGYPTWRYWYRLKHPRKYIF